MTTAAKQFKRQAAAITKDLRHRDLVETALTNYEASRDQKTGLFADWQGARDAAAAIKTQAIARLDEHIERLVKHLEARGTKVHFAADGAEACRIVKDIAAGHGVKAAVKSKSMTTEEIHLNDALAGAGVEVVESDLGEFIVQLRGEGPYHIVFPAMHLKRDEISRLFHDKLDSEETDSPEELTMIARRELRRRFCRADMGITGANFAVAETGMVAITENEGNARLTAALPKVMVTLLGIEKVVGRMADLALLWPMLASVGAGQLLSGYNTLYAGPRREGESDGPEEFHVVLLDNRRTALLADPELRDTLRCIRCGGCLNVCPIYRHVGGHTYGTTYSGPIGAVITPHLRGIAEFQHLSFASSLCGACGEICPVRIPLHRHMLTNRRRGAKVAGVWWQKLAFKMFNLVAGSRLLWKIITVGGRIGQVPHRLIAGSIIDPARCWTKTRKAPRFAKQSFKTWWRKRA